MKLKLKRLLPCMEESRSHHCPEGTLWRTPSPIACYADYYNKDIQGWQIFVACPVAILGVCMGE
jgi:hypothetical protein